MNTVEVEHLQHRYGRSKSGGQYAVDDVSFEVAEGEFFALLGPSGCGKTTTLRCIAGLEKPSSGVIRLNGAPVVSGKRYVPTYRRDIGMVFQDYAVWPHMTVMDNVAFPLTTGKRVPKQEIRNRVSSALAMVGLDHLSGRHATQLSGGQQQRLSLARALVREPAVLLLDEPLSNLDAGLRERMRSELRQIQQKVNVTTILVTHDQVEALSMATRIALMNEGGIVQIATPRDLYERPANRFAAQFVGTGTFYDGSVIATAVDGDPHALVIETGLGKVAATSHHSWTTGDRITLAIRPEHVRVHRTAPVESTNVFAGTVRNALYLGGSVDLHVEAGGQLLRADVPADEGAWSVDDAVHVEVAPQHAVVIAS
ncbi:MAG TPA: ABC transporter ATP-binding protein [Micromonosporaceae bacterium]